jgi:hypothetical protein
MRKLESALKVWLFPIGLAIGICILLMVGSRWVDFLVYSTPGGPWFRNFIFPPDPDLARDTILASLQTLAGVFGISITVVAIIVQLAATRYTSRVVDLFLKDVRNIGIFFVYVIPLVLGMWLANVLDDADYSRLAVGTFMILTTLAIVLIIPYFQFVFVFLQPHNIIAKIERSIESQLRDVSEKPRHVARARREVTNSLRQLSDIALASISQSDIVLCLESLSSIREVALYYLRVKATLPPEWHRIDSGHIVGLSDEMWQEIVRSRTWVEMEVFKQYEVAYTSTLRKVRDVNSFVARGMREIAEQAAVTMDDASLGFMIKGFNTLIMYALSERDIRSCVNVLYQYRLLAEALLYRPDILERIALHLKYYGHSSQRRRIYFILDAVAYDMRILVEMSFQHFPENGERLLKVFLELGQAAESSEDYTFLRGVRKSQAMLAGFFIRAGRIALARLILDDMMRETQEFLRSVKRDLFTVQSREFWEIEDRGVSFYFVEPEHRPSVELFFSWVMKESPIPLEIAQSA